MCSFTNVDEGFRQDVEFTPDGVFSVTVFPLGEVVAGTLMCGSLFEDMRRNYRREVLLSRRLARAGVVAQRFHYRGSGNSVGEPADMQWEHVLDDTRAALERLRTHVGASRPIGYFGSAFGALVALALGAGHREIPIALWEPVRDVDTYSKDLRRNELISNLADKSGADRLAGLAPSDSVPPEIAGRGTELSAAALAAPGLGPLLISRRGRDGQKAATAVDAELVKHAVSSTVRTYTDEAPWWSGAQVTVRSAGSKWRLLDDTVTWVQRATQKMATPA